MIVMTPQLAELRLQARRFYPEATWLPGDEPPCGERVQELSDGLIGTVQGVFTGKDSQPGEPLHCWWLVKIHDKRFEPPQLLLSWPPRLRRVV